MASVADVMGIIGTAVDAGSSISNGVYNIVNGERNYKLQLQNLAYQKALQNKIFEREDNAIQRRVEDLEKAGFSRLQALGSNGAGAGAVVNTSAPQKQMQDFAFKGALVDALRNNIEMKTSEKILEGVEKDNDIKDTDKKLKNLEYEKEVYDFEKYKEMDLPTSTKMTPTSIVGGYLGQNAQKVFNFLKTSSDNIVNDINEKNQARMLKREEIAKAKELEKQKKKAWKEKSFYEKYFDWR